MNEKNRIRLAKIQRRAKKRPSATLEQRLARYIARLDAEAKKDTEHDQKTA